MHSWVKDDGRDRRCLELNSISNWLDSPHQEISTVKYQKRLTPLFVIVQERVKTVQFVNTLLTQFMFQYYALLLYC